jgi:hypothetical protein
VVCLRAEQVRLEAGTHQKQTEVLRLRREAWSIQIEIARLQTPDQIRDRVERMQLGVAAPFDETREVANPTRLAVGDP